MSCASGVAGVKLKEATGGRLPICTNCDCVAPLSGAGDAEAHEVAPGRRVRALRRLPGAVVEHAVGVEVPRERRTVPVAVEVKVTTSPESGAAGVTENDATGGAAAAPLGSATKDGERGDGGNRAGERAAGRRRILAPIRGFRPVCTSAPL